MRQELRFLVGLIFMLGFITIFWPLIGALPLMYQYAIIIVSIVGFLILLNSI
jgi:hypothetical protein